MIVLKATLKQFKNLDGFKKGVSILKFTKNSNGDYIVGIEILNDNDFLEIREELLKLQQIEYVEPVIELMNDK